MAMKSNGEVNRQPLVPQSQLVRKYIREPSYSSTLGEKRHLFNVANVNKLANMRSPLEISMPLTPSQVDSPPSPVSSSYSELRQATRLPPGYYLQQQMMLSTSSKSPELLYEPVATTTPTRRHRLPPPPPSSSSVDTFGPCYACGSMVVGECSGLSAMSRVYHVSCFVCVQCGQSLHKAPFYALDHQPHCEQDYLLSLERCCECGKPIVERILRATGKPYHPQCFVCVVCKRSLDGVPFTVDAQNRVHCIDDFHRRFAPKCSVCKLPIMPEVGQEETVRVVALDRSFHVKCYRCEDCGLLLSSRADDKGCYPLDDHVLCKACNTKRIQHLTMTLDAA